MKSQTQDLIVRLSAAAAVAVAMMLTLQGFSAVSQHHFERSLAQHDQPAATQAKAQA